MLIEKIEIKNFRSIRDATVRCSSLTALLGRNGAGKSSILHALNVFYDVSASVTREDFFNNITEYDIEIRVTYKNLSDEETEEFSTYVHDEKLMVTKKIFVDEKEQIIQQYFGAAMQIPEFAEIRNISGKRNQSNRFNELIDTEKFDGLDQKARSADDAHSYMEDYEQEHPELTEPIERQKQFIGAASIGGGSLDNYTKFVLVPAVRDVAEEISTRKGAIYQLIDMIVASKINSRTDIQNFKEEYEERVQQLYSSENLTELPELGNSISELLSTFAPGSELNLYWDEVSLPEIKLPTPIATLVEDEFEGDISRKGHGLQRALILTLLHYLATTIPQKEKEELESEESVASSVPALIIAIEEPELYLHPSRSRYLAELFLELSGESINGTKNQILYATHSPYFVDLDRFDQVRLVRKVQNDSMEIQESQVTQFSLEEAAQALSEITDIDPKEFTDLSFKARALPIMNIIANEGFFADKVVVVEGTSDVGILWQMENIMDSNWTEKGIVIVPANGKNNIDRPVVIFRGLSIPTYFIFDGDNKYQGKNNNKEEQSITRNYRYLKLAEAPTDDFPDTSINETWAVFGNNIEAEIKDSIGEKNFYQVREEVSNLLGYDKPSQTMKNMYGASKVIEMIYKNGDSIPRFEELILAINSME